MRLSDVSHRSNSSIKKMVDSGVGHEFFRAFTLRVLHHVNKDRELDILKMRDLETICKSVTDCSQSCEWCCIKSIGRNKSGCSYPRCEKIGSCHRSWCISVSKQCVYCNSSFCRDHYQSVMCVCDYKGCMKIFCDKCGYHTDDSAWCKDHVGMCTGCDTFLPGGEQSECDCKEPTFKKLKLQQ